MLNAKSITGRVDRSVAALYRRADYIRSQAAAALEGGISEARGPENDGNVSVNNSGEGSPKESGDAEGSGRVLGKTPPGAGIPGRVEYNQEADMRFSNSRGIFRGCFIIIILFHFCAS